jgi:hypothetical protein
MVIPVYSSHGLGCSSTSTIGDVEVHTKQECFVKVLVINQHYVAQAWMGAADTLPTTVDTITVNGVTVNKMECFIQDNSRMCAARGEAVSDKQCFIYIAAMSRKGGDIGSRKRSFMDVAEGRTWPK